MFRFCYHQIVPLFLLGVLSKLNYFQVQKKGNNKLLEHRIAALRDNQRNLSKLNFTKLLHFCCDINSFSIFCFLYSFSLYFSLSLSSLFPFLYFFFSFSLYFLLSSSSLALSTFMYDENMIIFSLFVFFRTNVFVNEITSFVILGVLGFFCYIPLGEGFVVGRMFCKNHR